MKTKLLLTLSFLLLLVNSNKMLAQLAADEYTAAPTYTLGQLNYVEYDKCNSILKLAFPASFDGSAGQMPIYKSYIYVKVGGQWKLMLTIRGEDAGTSTCSAGTSNSGLAVEAFQSPYPDDVVSATSHYTACTSSNNINNTSGTFELTHVKRRIPHWSGAFARYAWFSYEDEQICETYNDNNEVLGPYMYKSVFSSPPRLATGHSTSMDQRPFDIWCYPANSAEWGIAMGIKNLPLAAFNGNSMAIRVYVEYRGNATSTWTQTGTPAESAISSKGTTDVHYAVFNYATSLNSIDAPFGLTASTNQCDKIVLNWQNPTQTWAAQLNCATNQNYLNFIYRNGIYIGKVKGDVSTYEDLSTNTVVPSGLTPLAERETYNYTVKTVLATELYTNATEFSYRISGASNVAIGNMLMPPAQPSPVTATDNKCNTLIDVNWSQPAGVAANTYNYWIYNTQTHIANNINLSGSTRSKAESVISRGINYQIKITAKNVCNYPSDTAVVYGISPADPDMASNVSVTTNTSNGTAIVNWTDNANNETKYQIVRSDDAGNTILTDVNPNTGSGATLTYTDNAVAACRFYTYKVRVFNDCVLSGITSTDFGTATLPPPNLGNTFDATHKLTGSKGYYNNRIEIKWANNNGVNIDQFKIFRKQIGSSADSVNIATLGTGSAIFNDLTADARVFYRYTIIGVKSCNGSEILTNTSSDIGFRFPTGLVAGHIEYDGGVAVPGAKVLVEQTTPTALGKSLKFSNGGMVSIKDTSTLETTSKMRCEFWIKAVSGTTDIIDKSGAFTFYNSGATYFASIVTNNGTYTCGTSIVNVPNGQWSHVALIYNGTVFKILTNGVQTASVEATGSIVNNNNNLTIGGANANFYIDEFRLLDSVQTDSIINIDKNRFMFGSESGFKTNIHFDEGFGNYAYDISKVGNIFNSNDAVITNTNVTWSADVPDPSQLGYFGITDLHGNYIVNGIQYSGTGESFKVQPNKDIHLFNPGTKLLFLGDNSSIQNGIDFIDKSSFLVTGTVKDYQYNCYVEGAAVYIDNMQVIKNNLPVVTTASGTFAVNVPIGVHTIKVDKLDHTFKIGESSYTKDFQAIENFYFYDSTRIKVIGRVVGGKTQDLKFPGRSKNNIGTATVNFTSLNAVNNGCTNISVTTNTATGEYEAYLPPNVYTQSITVSGNTAATNFFATPLPSNLDLRTVPLVVTLRDSVFDMLPGGVKHYNHTDSSIYQKRLNYVYTATPDFSVVNFQTKNEFRGEDTIMYKGGNITTPTKIDFRINPIGLTAGLTANRGVLIQGKTYDVGIKAFEMYKNFNNGKIDSVPYTEGKISVTNNLNGDNFTLDLKDIVNAPTFSRDTVKYTTYSFKPGNPNFSSTNTFSDKLTISLNPNSGATPPPAYIFSGIILGGKASTAQYFTLGPQIPDFILRDPPGSGSSATRSIGTKMEKQEDWAWNAGGSAEIQNKILVGTKMNIGLGVSTETEIEGNIGVGVSYSMSGGKNGSLNSSMETTKEWQTSESVKPGALSDIYIGHSKNLTFSKTRNLELIINSSIPTASPLTTTAFSPSLSLVEKPGIAVVPGGYNTSFIFTQDYILNNEIPRLKDVRNAILTSNPTGQYVSHQGQGTTHYGKNNDDPTLPGHNVNSPTLEDVGDITGASYTFTPDTVSPDKYRSDTLRFFNQQIRLWQEAIKLNEMEKVIVANKTKRDSVMNKQLIDLKAQYQTSIDKYTYWHNVQVGASGAGLASSLALMALPTVGAIAGGITAGVMYGTTVGSASHVGEVENDYNEYLAKKANIEQLFSNYDQQVENITYTGGTTYNSAQTSELVASYGSSVEYALGVAALGEVKAAVSNNGFQVEGSISVDFNNSHSSTSTNTSNKAISYTLADDLGDEFAVDVYPSIFGFGPIFKRKPGGATKCPYEAQEVTQFYQPGTLLSDSTRRREQPKITVVNSLMTNVPMANSANFDITLQDLNDPAAEPYSQVYSLAVNQISNPYGANISFANGGDQMDVVLGPGQSFNTVIMVTAGPNDTITDYNNLEIQFKSACQSSAEFGEMQIISKVYITAKYIPTCSSVSLLTPQNNWVLNNNNNTLQNIISDYNINMMSLKHLELQYKPSSSPYWTPIEIFHKDTTGLLDTSAILLSSNGGSHLFDWITKPLVDGSYDLRVVSHCLKADNYSDIYTGVMDRVNPTPFGTPSPADGVLDPNDDIMIQFNEPLDYGTLGTNNVEVKGVLNSTNNSQDNSLYFNGSNSYAVVNGGTDIRNRSFTIEFYARRGTNGEQAIISQNTDPSNALFIGFNSNDNFCMRFGNKEIATTTSYTTSTWTHFAVVYTINSLPASVPSCELYENGILRNTILNIVERYNGTGKLYFGKNIASNSSFFNGDLSDVRLWNKAKTAGDISAEKGIIVGTNTSGLMYNWMLDESEGANAIDRVRRRDATLINTTWKVYPVSYNAQFTGSDVISIPTSKTVISKESDFTLEFWFNSNNQPGVETLFSNGKGDGFGSDSLKSWNIEKDAAGLIHVKHNAIDFVATNNNYFDGTWHHFALILQRNGNLSSYVDGNLQFTTPANAFYKLEADSAKLGARVYYTGNTYNVDQHYIGKIDEFRIWNSARKVEQVKRDKLFRLIGNEMGLYTYLPMERYTFSGSSPSLTPSLRVYSSIAIGADTMASMTNSAQLSNTNAPTIKLPRPTKTIIPSLVLNNDKIVIDVSGTSSYSLTENVTLDITVKDVNDLNGNTMQSAKTWIAYVNKNQVKWQDVEFMFTKTVDSSIVFTANIVNTGGALKIFDIGNVPNWMTVNTTHSSISPNSVKTLTFTIPAGQSIGEYIAGITLTTDFGYDEVLQITDIVKGTAPTWSVNPSNFQYQMNVFGQFKIDNVIATNPESKIAAFNNGVICGVANLQYVQAYDRYEAFLNIYSNNNTGDSIKFNIYDATTGITFVSVTPNLMFVENDVQGTISNPITFVANTEVAYNIPLNAGWTWFSLPLKSSKLSNSNLLMNSVSSTNGDVVRSNSQFDQYSGAWYGNISQGSGYFNNQTYKVKLTNMDTLVHIGSRLNPDSIQANINVVPGWNWIGFIANKNLTISEAMGNYNAQTGDLLKSQYQFAYYDNLTGWSGSLTFLKPTLGYMLKSSGTSVFNYHVSGFNARLLNINEEVVTSQSIFSFSPEQYANTMSAIITGNICNESLDQGNIAVGVFDNLSNLRGYAFPIKNSVTNKYNFYLTAYSNVNSETLNVKYFNITNGAVLSTNKNVTFVTDGIVGSPSSPIVALVDDSVACNVVLNTTSVNEIDSNTSISVYPNPFNDNITIHFSSSVTCNVELVDMLGKVVHSSSIKNKKEYNILTDVIKTNISAGMYYIRLTGDINQQIKVIKTK